MPRLPLALEAAYKAQRTPLLLDCTGGADGGSGSGSGGFSPLETYYFYSGDHLIELKRMVVEVNVTKERLLADALADARSRLVRALRYGGSLVFLLADSAPPLRSQFSSPSQLPYALLAEPASVLRSRGAGGAWRAEPWAAALLTDADEVFQVHEDFGVVAVTRFRDPAEVSEFLGDELPLEAMQLIRVTTAAATPAAAPAAAAAAVPGR